MAGQEIGEAFVRIRPKTDGFEREAEAQLNPAAKRAGESVSKQLTEALTAGAFVAFSATVVRSAAEAEQAVGGTAAVFKDSADQIDAFAQGSADALGLTEQAARQFSSQIGSSLKGYGFSVQEAADTSERLITKGADLTALFGGSVPEAVTAMSSALRGEFDPLERYGVSLTAASVAAKAVSLGLAESTSSVDGHAKAVATLAIIEEQTADATGQFARELGTAGGQMAVATAKLGDARDELGSRFLPLVTKGAGVVSALADGFGALPAPIQAATAGIVGLIALSGPIGRVGDAVGGLRDDFRSGGEAAGEFRGKLSALAKTGTIVAGIAAITGGIESFKAATESAQSDFASSLPDPSDIQGYRDAVNQAIERQAELSDELNRFTDEGSDASEIPAQLGAAWNFFTSTITGNTSAVGALKAEYDALSASLPAAKIKAEELTERVNKLGERLGISGTQAATFVRQFKGLDISQVPLEKLAKAFDDLRNGADVAQVAQDLGVEVKTAGDNAADAATKLEDLRSGLFGLVDASNAYVDSAQRVTDAERAAEKATFAIVDAQRAAADAQQGVVDAQEGYQDSLEATAEAERRRVDALDRVADAQEGVIDAQRRLDEALAGPTESDDLDLEAAEIRLRQMRESLADNEDPDDRRLAEIEIRRAEIELAERRAEIDGRAAIAQDELTDAADRLTEAQRAADDAARAVTEAHEAEIDAARRIESAQYSAGKAYDAITTAQHNAEKASRDVERAKFDQLKASEELAGKIGEEQAAFAGANGEVSKLADYYRNLIALRPELATAIAPLLALLEAAATSQPATGAQTTAPTRDPGTGPATAPSGPPSSGGPSATYQPPGIYDGVYWPGGIVYNGAPTSVAGGNNMGASVTVHVNGAGADETAREVVRRINDELALATGW